MPTPAEGYTYGVAAPGNDDPAVGGWRAWALADALDRARDRERAVAWINAAIHSLGHGELPGPQILKAEVLATAGRMTLDHGDVGDASQLRNMQIFEP